MLGPETDCSNIKEPFSGILVTLKQVNIPIVSVDVPSGKILRLPAGLRGGETLGWGHCDENATQ